MATPLLTAAQIAELQTAIAGTEAGKQICQKGAACGFDLASTEAVLHELQLRLAATIKNFGPVGISPS